MFDWKKTRLFALLGWSIAVVACEDSTGLPDVENDFDTQAAIEDYRALDGIFGSEGWAGFQSLGTRAPIGALGANAVGGIGVTNAMSKFAVDGDAQGFAVAMALAVRSLGQRRAPIISNLSRGTTFVYDPEIGEYRPDPTRTGAPATGVRFILYDESSGQINADLEIGHADLIDEGDGSDEDIALRFLCVQDGLTILDYRTTLTELGEGGRITVDGFLQNEMDRLDFDIDVEGSEGEELSTVDIQFDMGIASREFSIQGSITGSDGADDSGEIEISVTHGRDTLRVEMRGDDSTLDGTFSLNGEVFAMASGSADSPTFTNRNGGPLSGGEIGMLIQAVAVVGEVFGLFEGLVAPIAGLVALGIIL